MVVEKALVVVVAGGLVVVTSCVVLVDVVVAGVVVLVVDETTVVTGGNVTVTAPVIVVENTGAELVPDTIVVLTTEVGVVVATVESHPANFGQSHTFSFGFQCKPGGQFFSTWPLWLQM